MKTIGVNKNGIVSEIIETLKNLFSILDGEKYRNTNSVVKELPEELKNSIEEIDSLATFYSDTGKLPNSFEPSKGNSIETSAIETSAEVFNTIEIPSSKHPTDKSKTANKNEGRDR